MIYKLEGIKNPIEWDGVNTPKPLRNHGKGYLSSCCWSRYEPHRLYFQVRDEDGKLVRISIGRLIFMLRNGVSLAQCREHKVSCNEDGTLRETRKRKPQWTLFGTLEECERTIRIIRDLQNGNPSSLYEHINSEKNFLKFHAWRDYRISRSRFDYLFDDALLMLEKNLTTCYFRHLQKVTVYFMRYLYMLHKRTPKHVLFNEL